MNRRRNNAVSPLRSGFTLVEVMMVGALMTFMAILLSSAWGGLGRSAADAAVRSQLLQELDLTVAALGRDLGGSRPIPSSSTIPDPDYGGKHNGELVFCQPGTHTEPNDMLVLKYANDPETEVHYYLADDPDASVPTKILVRADITAGTTFTVARCVSDMTVEYDPSWTSIILTFKQSRPFAEYTRTCTFKAKYLPEL